MDGVRGGPSSVSHGVKEGTVADNIQQDHRRYRRIVRGEIKDNLKKYMTEGNLRGKVGDRNVSIPVPRIDLPKFTHGRRDQGVGQGDGEPGDQVAPGDGDGQSGEGDAGEQPGEHDLEVEVDIDELAEIMGEELELPRIEPKGDDNIEATNRSYKGMRKSGPETLRNFKKTYQEALKREIASGEYDPEDPVIVPIDDDKRYRSVNIEKEPENNAVLIYMMDVSGSMQGEQKEIVRTETFWIDTWIRSQYDGVETRYLIHDARAKEVGRDEFFSTRESGGTMISSAYKLAKRIMSEDYPIQDWNVYTFHFSDGDNWSSEDNEVCMSLLEDFVVPNSNLFCYGQVESQFGSGKFIDPLRRKFEDDERVALSEIDGREDIHDSIQTFLGKGR